VIENEIGTEFIKKKKKSLISRRILMPGRIKKLIDRIIEKRSQGDKTVAKTTQTKLILKGINPSHYDQNSDDDPVVLDKLKKIAQDFNISI